MDVIYGVTATRIRSRPVTAWVVEMPGGEREIYLFHSEAQLEEVMEFVRLSHREFKVGMLGTGAYALGGPVSGCYRDDARWVDQDMRVTI